MGQDGRNDQMDDFLYDLRLQVQGEAVEIPDGLPAAVAALTLAAAYELSAEVVFRPRDDDDFRVLIFDHQGMPQEQLFRPDEVNETLWSEIKQAIETVTPVSEYLTPSSDTEIDLSNVWSAVPDSAVDAHANNTDDSSLLADRTKQFARSLVGQLRHGLHLHLFGEIPTLPLLVAVYLSRPFGLTVDYTDKSGRKATLFS
ncbi:hypothetical protein COY93_02310 [Candidatus Uhrbacteria bacterium CG_4_10_14_0_8_um_filter_58_22]|uniref:Uncharacterized protein n=1 Tax=Candidatus Uhrbacteria bacterium CG_4_10_14_0_8_um_filter_58_22 TaxID=1975029 RepID=A0A2M7QA61_9BACT|nr:MAG: hypothetical protein AUJ19_02490 [Parcubacteria group bacterium CG1_02_58_44]PIY62806.1 MAG: hypothetical protein COY93_02310 [Candidatus Uhrbacteria bacterium CG_4_10_14_0_8_um_filter_58_22]